jgi:hypothetical protein
MRKGILLCFSFSFLLFLNSFFARQAEEVEKGYFGHE